LETPPKANPNPSPNPNTLTLALTLTPPKATPTPNPNPSPDPNATQGHPNADTPTICNFAVPEAYVDRKWAAVFLDLVLNRACVPIALFRAPESYEYEDEEGEVANEGGNELPFVYANPKPDTVVARGDSIIGLCIQGGKDDMPPAVSVAL
jgi:hypothetical protein